LHIPRDIHQDSWDSMKDTLRANVAIKQCVRPLSNRTLDIFYEAFSDFPIVVG